MNTPLYHEWRALQDCNPDVWQQNLRNISINHPHLINSLQTAYQQHHLLIQVSQDGWTRLKEETHSHSETVHDAHTLQNERMRVESTISSMFPQPHTQLFYVLGMDLGFTLQKLLPFITQSPLSAFVVVEPDARLAAAAFAMTNLSSVLRSNRIDFVVGEDFEAQLETLFMRKNYFAVKDIKVFSSTTANRPHDTPQWERLRQKTKQLQLSGQQQFHREMEAIRQYYRQKPYQPIHSMFSLVQTQGLAVRYIQQRFLDECRRLGIQVIEHPPGFANEVGIMRAIHRHQPDCLLFINRSPGEYVDLELLNSLKLPRMVWCVDDPTVLSKTRFAVMTSFLHGIFLTKKI